jgi:hypothetical protein
MSRSHLRLAAAGVSQRTTPICAIALFRVNRLLAQERRHDAHLLAQAVTARRRAS